MFLYLFDAKGARRLPVFRGAQAPSRAVFRSKSFSRLENNDSLYDFTPLRIGYPKNRYFAKRTL
jgi:hypothetical protein